MKSYLIDLGLAFLAFLIGFFGTAILRRWRRQTKMKKRIAWAVRHGKVLKIPRPREWPDPDEQWKSARDAYGGKAEHET